MLDKLLNHRAWMPFWAFIFVCTTCDIAWLRWTASQDNADIEAALDAEMERLDDHNLEEWE